MKTEIKETTWPYQLAHLGNGQDHSMNAHLPVTKGFSTAWTLAGLTLWLFIPWCTWIHLALVLIRLKSLSACVADFPLQICSCGVLCVISAFLPSLHAHHADKL